MPWSFDLCAIMAGVIVFGIACGTIGLVGILKCFGYEKDSPSPITCRELIFIWYAGMIRGAIAFGLVLRISPSFENREVIMTTCLSLVIATTIFFGSTVGVLGKCLFRGKPEINVQDSDEGSNSSFAED